MPSVSSVLGAVNRTGGESHAACSSWSWNRMARGCARSCGPDPVGLWIRRRARRLGRGRGLLRRDQRAVLVDQERGVRRRVLRRRRTATTTRPASTRSPASPGPRHGCRRSCSSGTRRTSRSSDAASIGAAIAEQDAPLKIIGATFQKNPFTILSLADGGDIAHPRRPHRQEDRRAGLERERCSRRCSRPTASTRAERDDRAGRSSTRRR